MANKHKNKKHGQKASMPAGWPEPLDEKAFQGLLGKIVRTIEPHTEADPAALLGQMATAFGSLIGRNPHFMVEATRHSGNLSSAFVGISSKSRKGTSWGYELELFRLVDRSWVRKRVQPGLSTGEGLIQTLVELDPHDRRRLVFEDEMSAMFRVMSRWGNTLSTTLRRAWDSQPLCHATGLTVAHLLGHANTQILPTYVRPLDENTRALIEAMDTARKNQPLAPHSIN
jgi:hypothetical protein